MAVIQQTKFETLPMGEYSATIADIQIVEGMYGEQCEFTFAIDGGQHDGANLRHWTSAKFSPRSKLYHLARAAFGRDIPASYDLNTDDLLNRKVNLTVIVRVKVEDGTEFNKVDGIRPWRQLDEHGRPAAQQAAMPAAGQPVATVAPALSRVIEEDEVPF